jgi:hypothetical protein
MEQTAQDVLPASMGYEWTGSVFFVPLFFVLFQTRSEWRSNKRSTALLSATVRSNA